MRRCDKSVRCSGIGYGVRKRHRVTPNDSVAATANDITENTAVVDLEELEVKANTVVMDGKRTTLIPDTVRQEIRIRRHRISAGYSTPSVYHSSVSDQRYPSYYYLNGTWAWNGLYIGLSFEVRSENRLSAIPRAWTRETTSTTRHITIPPIVQNIELTVTYSFGYGKKTSKDDEVRKIGGGDSIILK